jgi:hypothetical protein
MLNTLEIKDLLLAVGQNSVWRATRRGRQDAQPPLSLAKTSNLPF